MAMMMAVIACSGSGGKTLTSAEALKEYLDKQPANSPDKPIKVTMGANDQMLNNIAKAITSAGKYVSLSLSGSALTTIPEKAFSGCTSLTSVTIPNGVTEIGNQTFQNCTSLTSITIPDSVTDMGANAFFNCTKLASVTLGNSVTNIERGAFTSCISLKTITIPESVTNIGVSAFSGCDSLTSVTFQGMINRDRLGETYYSPFPGDLRAKYLASDGGPGTYTRFANGEVWKKTQSITTQPTTTQQQTTTQTTQPTTTQQPVAQPETPVPNGFVRINGGTFTMGSPDNEPGRNSVEVQQQVRLGSFYMSKYEVTQKEYQEVMGKNPSKFKGDNLPVENVTWSNAIEYCNKRSQKEGLTPAYTGSGTNITLNQDANGYRLPDRAQWEYACRAGTTTAFNNGNNDYINTSSVGEVGWYAANSGRKTHEVGLKNPNAWGLYDMHGNVSEWCWGGVSGNTLLRVNKGGSWDSIAQNLRSAYYDVRNILTNGGSGVGIRLVRRF
jgi:formylglycine-generating enzyme required for sulfatase activity